jgi:hypothetical protein
MQETKKKEELNELDDKEIQCYRPHKYFIDVLTNTTDNDNLIEHYKYLLLSLLVLQPPVRTSFYTTARYLDRQADEQKNINYVYTLNRGKQQAFLIINKDKASNYKLYNTNKHLSKIEIIDDSLAKLIANSFLKFPRAYLFQINSKPISSSTLLKWLRDITGVDGLTVDIMRSSYITWFYSENQTYGARDDLSKKMRHSQATASKNYFKVFNDGELNNNVLHVDKLKNNVSVYTDTPADVKASSKKRNDVIYTANVKGITPKASTLAKYNITYDADKKLFI